MTVSTEMAAEIIGRMPQEHDLAELVPVELVRARCQVLQQVDLVGLIGTFAPECGWVSFVGNEPSVEVFAAGNLCLPKEGQMIMDGEYSGKGSTGLRVEDGDHGIGWELSLTALGTFPPSLHEQADWKIAPPVPALMERRRICLDPRFATSEDGDMAILYDVFWTHVPQFGYRESASMFAGLTRAKFDAR